MTRTTMRELRALIASGTAHDLQGCSPHDVESLRQIAYSAGVYGITGALFEGRDSGELYAIVGRTSTLFAFA